MSRRYYGRLPVEKLDDRKLWSTLQGRIARIEMEASSWPGKEAVLWAAHDAQACAQELRQRGAVMTLAEDIPFPRELPQVAQTGLIPPRA